MIRRGLIISSDRFPNGDAGAVRQEILAKIFVKLGYEMTVIGMGESTDFKIAEINGIKYLSLRSTGSSMKARLGNQVLYSHHLKEYLKKDKRFDFFLVVSIPIPALLYIKKYAAENQVRLLHDSVEWYSPEQFKNRKLSFQYIIKNLYNTRWIDKQFSVIAISSYLEKHFASNGIKTVRIPAILDVNSVDCDKLCREDKIVFLYAGSPGKKDYLKEIIHGFALIEKSKMPRMELRVIGIREDSLYSECGVDRADIKVLGQTIQITGRVPRDQVLLNLKSADFTVLLRDEAMRYAKAGFPTKVSESLASGTPVVCNMSSDLSMYIEDGNNGFRVKNCSSEALAEAIMRILKLNYSERKQLQENARKTAEKNFHFGLYTDKIKSLLEREVL